MGQVQSTSTGASTDASTTPSSTRASFSQTSDGSKLSAQSKGALLMMNGFGVVGAGRSGDAVSSKSTDGSSSDGSRSPLLSMPSMSDCMKLQQPPQPPRKGRTTSSLVVTGALEPRSRSHRRPPTNHHKTLKTPRSSTTVLDSCDWTQHLHDLPSAAAAAKEPPRTPSQPVKCPPRRRVLGEDHETAVAVLPSAVLPGSLANDGDPAEEDVLYLKRLYEMRTWDMYVRITEARKQRDQNKGTSGGVRGVVPMVPALDPPDPALIASLQAQQQLLDAAATGDIMVTGSDHEMIFDCDLE